jgi:hypothetical protein
MATQNEKAMSIPTKGSNNKESKIFDGYIAKYRRRRALLKLQEELKQRRELIIKNREITERATSHSQKQGEFRKGLSVIRQKRKSYPRNRIHSFDQITLSLNEKLNAEKNSTELAIKYLSDLKSEGKLNKEELTILCKPLVSRLVEVEVSKGVRDLNNLITKLFI